jgi:phosphoribosylformylglycinamidine synthase
MGRPPSGRARESATDPLGGTGRKLRPWLPVVAVIAGLAIFLYAVFFAESEEEKVRGRLGELADAVAVREGETNPLLRGARLKDAFEELLAKEVVVRIPELAGAVAGRRDLVGIATQAASLWRTASFDLGGLRLELDEPKTSAHATGEIMLVGTRHSGEPERDERSVSIRLDKIEGRWLVVSIAVSAPSEAER